jgi:hypothetical protein
MGISLELTTEVPTVRGVLDLPLTKLTMRIRGNYVNSKIEILAGKGLSDREILNIILEDVAKQLHYAYEVGRREGIASVTDEMLAHNRAG